MNHVRQKIRAAIRRDVRPPLPQVIETLTPLLRGWSGYYNLLNSGLHFRKVDQYVVWKLQRWLRRKQQRTRRAFRRPSPEWWAAHGLFRGEGTSVRVW
jgi:RNA-directed DNA polymerase